MGASVFKSEKRIRYALIGVFLTIAGAVACVLPSTAFAAWSTTNISDMNSQRTSSVYFNRNYNYYDNAVVTMGSGVSMITSSEWPGSHSSVKSYVVSNAHGTTTNPLTIKLPGYGYTVEGKSVDMLITITSVYMEGDAFSGDDSNNYFLEIAKGKLDPNYPVDGWICLDSPAWWRTEIKFNIKLYYAGTNTLVPNTIRGTTASYLYEFNDLDAVNAILHGSPGNWSYEYSTSWYEQITRRGSNFEDVAYRYSNSVVYTSDNATYRAKADSEGGHGTGDYDDEGTILFHGRNNADFTWRGVGCGTLLGIAGQVKTYPNFTAPVKTPATQTKKKGETCSAFVIDQWLPAVGPDNKPSSIVVTDVFDNALDITGATGKVTKDGIDVSSSWTFAKNGQTVTFTAKNTAHGGNAEGDLKFAISGVKVKSNANLSSYSTTTDSSSGRTCWVIKNTASTKVTATYGGGTKTTPPVDVLVPQPANVIYQYVGNVHPQDEPAVPTVAANTYFIGDNYTAAAAVSDSHNQYNFLGWYSDSACTTKWPASGKKLTAATTYLYGKWEPKPVNITYQPIPGTSTRPIPPSRL